MNLAQRTTKSKNKPRRLDAPGIDLYEGKRRIKRIRKEFVPPNIKEDLSISEREEAYKRLVANPEEESRKIVIVWENISDRLGRHCKRVYFPLCLNNRSTPRDLLTYLRGERILPWVENPRHKRGAVEAPNFRLRDEFPREFTYYHLVEKKIIFGKEGFNLMKGRLKELISPTSIERGIRTVELY